VGQRGTAWESAWTVNFWFGLHSVNKYLGTLKISEYRPRLSVQKLES
jgi:hypothetical protein